MNRITLKNYLIVLLIFGLLLLVSSIACAENDNEVSILDRVLKEGVLKVGVPNYVGWSRINPNTGEWEGITIDLFNYLAKEMNVKPEYIEVDWQIMPLALENGDIDIYGGTCHFTIARAMKVAFPYPAFFKATGLICRTEDAEKFKTIDDINKPNVSIAVGIGTREDQMSEYLFPKANVLKMKTGTHTELAEAVRSGQADLTGFGHEEAWQFGKDFDWCVMPIPPFAPSMQSYPVKYGDMKWLRFIDSYLQYMTFSGLLDAIYKNNFPDLPDEMRNLKFN